MGVTNIKVVDAFYPMGNNTSVRYENAKRTGSLQLSNLKLSKVRYFFFNEALVPRRYSEIGKSAHSRCIIEQNLRD